MAKIFVSYSRKDSAAARKLVEAFKAIGLEVWVDWEDIPLAAEWLNQIFTGIEEADAFLFMISPDSIISDVCKVEISRAVQNNKRIIPIVLRDVNPNDTLEDIRKLNWTFIRETDDFDEGVAKVRTAIELDLDWLEEHRRLQVRALEWHRKKDTSLLLRGRDLRNARHMLETYTSKDPIPTELQQKYIDFSQRAERTRTIMWIVTGVVVILLAGLSIFAANQSRLATENAQIANVNAQVAMQNEEQARKNEEEANKQRSAAEAAREEAEAARALAETNEKEAEAQRSTARAQIFQNRPGELYTSTLLAIDSLKKLASDEADEILRRNISLLPSPVAQAFQPEKVNAMAFSPVDDIFATGSADGTTCAWSAIDGKKIFCNPPGESSVNAVAFSPDGTVIVTGDQAGLVRILDAKNGNEQYVYQRTKTRSGSTALVDVKSSALTSEQPPSNQPIRSIAVRSLPKGQQQVAVAYEDGEIPLFDPQTGKISSPLRAGTKPNIIDFSRIGNWLVAGSEGGHISIWNLSNTKEAYPGLGLRGDILTMAFHPNQSVLAVGGNDNTVALISLLSKKELLRLPTQNTVRALAFSPDGSWIVTASDDHRIRIWDAESGTERLSMSQEDSVTDIVVSPNGQWIATTGEDRTARVWDAVTGAEIFQIPLKAGGSLLAFSNEGDHLVSTDESGAINIWDVSQMQAPKVIRQFDDSLDHAQYSPSGERLAVSAGKRLWLLTPDPESALREREPGSPANVFRSNIRSLVFSPDSKLLGVLTEGNEVAIYNTETRKLKMLAVPGLIQAIAFSPDNQQFITSDTAGNIQAWDAVNATLIEDPAQKFPPASSLATSSQFTAFGAKDKINILGMDGNGDISPVEAAGENNIIVFNQDGSLLAAADSAGRINIWKHQNGAFVPVSSFIKERASSLAFNPEGTLLAVGTPKYVLLMDIASGQESARIPHKDTVNGVSFSSDGSYLATVSSRLLQFWETGKFRPIENDQLISAACSRMYENFSRSQWEALFGSSQPYEKLCENLPEPGSE